ncbi:MAG: hypothetical protein V9G20_26920 [Candidatus Promineifilaceae bacterium]
MYVLHLHWHTPTQPGETGHFLLWMESALAPQPSRNRRLKSSQPHPFAANKDELRQLLTDIRLRGKLPVKTLDLWLPTNRFGPIPSPELIHDWESDDNQAELSSWTVTGTTLDALQALHLLTWLHQNELPSPYRLGSDGRYWQTLFPFVLELLAHQLYRPTLLEIREKPGVRFEARWQTLLDGENEAHHAAQLAAAMPAVCRASAANPNETIPPRAILDSFLNHLTDAAIRHWASAREMTLPTSNDAAAILAPRPFLPRTYHPGSRWTTPTPGPRHAGLGTCPHPGGRQTVSHCLTPGSPAPTRDNPPHQRGSRLATPLPSASPR